MDAIALVIGFTYIFKLAQLIFGLLIVYMGYKITVSQKNKTLGPIGGEAGGMGVLWKLKFAFEKMPSGPFLVVCGVLVMGMGIFKGVDVEIDPSCFKKPQNIVIPDKIPR